MGIRKVTPEDWLTRLRKGQRFKKQFGNSEDWQTYRNYYRGEFPGAREGNILPYNLTYLIADTLVPTVYYRNPRIKVTPRPYMGQYDPTLQARARIVESIDNWLVQELSLDQTMQDAVLDAFLCGRAFIKVGFDSKFGVSEDDVSADKFRDASYTTQRDKRTGNYDIEMDAMVKPGMPYAIRIDPDMILVPYGLHSRLAEAQWIDHLVLRQLEAVKRDSKYKNTRDLKETHLDKAWLMDQKSHLYEELSSDDSMKWVEIHEIHDRMRREVTALVPDIESGSIIRGPEEDTMQIDGMPFISFAFNRDPEYFWSASGAKIIEPQQKEINEARTQAMLHRRVALLKLLVDKNLMSEEEITKLTSPDVMPIIRCEGGNISDRIEAVKPNIPPDLVEWGSVIREDTRDITGFGRVQTGTANKGRRTATEVERQQLGYNLRMGRRRQIVAKAFSSVVRKLNQIMNKFWSEEKVVQVVGIDGARYWVKYGPEDLKHEFDYKVDVESMVPTNTRTRRQEIVEIIRALGNHPTANLDYLMRVLLRQYDWVDAMQVLPPAQETMGGPMGSREFIQQQQGLRQNPERMQKRTSSNANRLALGAGSPPPEE